MRSLLGKVIAVTGGARGIGEATARALAGAGARHRALSVVPRLLTLPAGQWPMTPSRAKPWLRRRFGLDQVFTSYDEQARADYDSRIGS